jgi:type I restriction enzyme, S subunit
MTTIPNIPLGEIIAERLGSVDPSRYPDEVFDLYSIPAFDRGQPEITSGGSVGSAKQIVQPGDVLLSRIVPHIRRAWVVGKETGRRKIGSGEWIVFRSDRIDPNYLRQVLVSDQFHAQFMSTVSGVGGSLLRARPAHVAKIKISLPPLQQQRRIATMLDQAEALRAQRRAALAVVDTLAGAVFLDLFGDMWMKPKSLKLEPLGEHLRFVTSGGRGWAKFYASNGARFIRSLDVQMNFIGDIDKTYVVPPDNAEALRTRVQNGDVLLTITGSRIGRVAPVPEDLEGAYISQHVAILRIDPKTLDPRFLSFFLSLDTGGQRQIAKVQYGQTKPGLNFEQIRRFQIPVPPIHEQDEFVRRIKAVDKLKATNCSSLNHIERLFAALQHRAFRGEL